MYKNMVLYGLNAARRLSDILSLTLIVSFLLGLLRFMTHSMVLFDVPVRMMRSCLEAGGAGRRIGNY